MRHFPAARAFAIISWCRQFTLVARVVFPQRFLGYSWLKGWSPNFETGHRYSDLERGRVLLGCPESVQIGLWSGNALVDWGKLPKPVSCITRRYYPQQLTGAAAGDAPSSFLFCATSTGWGIERSKSTSPEEAVREANRSTKVQIGN